MLFNNEHFLVLTVYMKNRLKITYRRDYFKMKIWLMLNRTQKQTKF